MSTARTKKSLQELIASAAEEHTFVRVALFETVKDGKKKRSLGRKPNLSIGGAQAQWAKREFFYWPETRLAGTDWADLISYACINKLPVVMGSSGRRSRMKSGKTYDLGPFIGYDSEAEAPGTFMVNAEIGASDSGTLISTKAQYMDGGKIPVYSYSYTPGEKGDKKDPGTITIESGKPKYLPVAFIDHEKAEHTTYNKSQKTAANKEADLDALNLHIFKYKIPSKSGKSSKSGESKRAATTYESFMGAAFKERVAAQVKSEKAKSSNPDDYWLDISKLSENLSGSRLIVKDKLNDKHIRYKDTRIVFKEDSNNREGAIWFFRAKNGWVVSASDSDNEEAAKAAKSELKKVIQANVRPPLTGKKAGDSSEEESKKSPKKNKKDKGKSKKAASSEEEEEESGEEEVSD